MQFFHAHAVQLCYMKLLLVASATFSWQQRKISLDVFLHICLILFFCFNLDICYGGSSRFNSSLLDEEEENECIKTKKI